MSEWWLWGAALVAVIGLQVMMTEAMRRFRGHLWRKRARKSDVS